jgi:UDP:flavonoid glycosyltransferase YjiC (YdhE family)
MNILIHVWGSLGDVHPFLAVGLALRARGNSVTVLSTGNFEALIRGTGLGFHAIAGAADYAAVLRNPATWNAASAEELIDKYLEALAEPTCRYISQQQRLGNTLVIAATRGIRMREILAPLHVPLVVAHLTPEIFYADKSTSKVGLFPDWFAGVMPDDPDATLMTGFALYAGDEEKRIGDAWPRLEAFLADGAKPIVFTPGTAMLQGKSFFESALQACDSLGRRALFLSPFAEQIPPRLPTAVAHFDYLPLWRLLPHALALVYHGGVGTCAQALRHAVPQLVMPWAYDQFANAGRVKRFGAGDFLDSQSCTSAVLAEKLHALITSESVHATCQRIAGNFGDSDGIGKTCDLIAALGTRSGTSV